MTELTRDAGCTKTVLLRGASVKKMDVPLGKEFVEDGRVCQTSMSAPVKFELVEVDQRFKIGDEWGVKTSASLAYALDPNMPFGRSSLKRMDMLGGQMVRVLTIDDRGPAQ